MYTHIKTYFLWLLLSLPLLGMAQQPVQVSVQMIPPYSVTLSDYAVANSDRLVATLLLGDVTEFNRQVELRLAIKGNGLAVQSASVIAGTTPISLDGGVPRRLTSIDLRPYFELDNLVGISPVQYSRSLPAGLYQFCFEVYDFLTGRLISTQTCATAYIILNDPPILNLPVRNENITFKDPQNIIFNWTPRHVNATNIQYEFTLAEIWDTNIDPQAAFLASRPLYQTTTRSTTLLYGPAETPLLPDKTYGWRVRAVALDGISELSLFKNGGYSEIYHFNYTQLCSEPKFVLSEPSGYNKAQIYWQGQDHLKYQVQYRKKDGNNSGWFEVNAYNENAKIQRLEENTTYEYRVGGQCGYNGGYTFSRIFEFTTGIRGEDKDFNCGVTPERNISNQDPLPLIGTNEIFTAGEFPVTVKQVEGENGLFSGWGYIVVPYLADTRIKISFNRIRINTDYQLTDGVLVTDYDPEWGGVDDIGDELQSLEQLISGIKNTIDRLLQNGDITQERADTEYQELATLQTNSEQASDALEQANQNLDDVQEEGTEQETQEAKEEVKLQEQSLADAREALENKSKELKALSSEGEVKEDLTGFFDGYLRITSASNQNSIIARPDSNRSITIPTPNNDENTEIKTFYEDYTVNIEGTSYSFIFTSSASSEEEIKRAREKISRPETDIAIYYHYDLEEGQLGYRVEMSREYFSSGINFNEEEFEWSRAAFKRGVKNMINDINSVEDWSAEILDIAERLNKYRIKPLLAETKMPEEMWNPDHEIYDQVPVHIPPIGAGLTDGVIDEATGIAQLFSLVIDYSTDERVKRKIDSTLTELDTDAVIQYAEKFIDNRSELYETGTYHQIEYQSGKDVVTAVTIITGAKALKESAEFIGDLVGGIKKNVDKLKVFKNVDELVSSIVKNRKKIRDVLDTSEGMEYARKYFDKYVEGKNFDEWWAYAKRYDLKDDLNFEVHHIIPIKVFESNKLLQDLLFWAHKQGKKFDFNSIDNGIPLQKKKAKIDLNGHTNHPKYDIAIREKINEILDDIDLDEFEKFDEIQDLIDNIKNKLEKEVLLGNNDVNQIIDF